MRFLPSWATIRPRCFFLKLTRYLSNVSRHFSSLTFIKCLDIHKISPIDSASLSWFLGLFIYSIYFSILTHFLTHFQCWPIFDPFSILTLFWPIFNFDPFLTQVVGHSGSGKLCAAFFYPFFTNLFFYPPFLPLFLPIFLPRWWVTVGQGSCALPVRNHSQTTDSLPWAPFFTKRASGGYIVYTGRW